MYYLYKYATNISGYKYNYKIWMIKLKINLSTGNPLGNVGSLLMCLKFT